MAEISASTVMELRKISGPGMMNCKKALQESSGDIKGAMEILRKKGLATLAKRAGRVTSEGVVLAKNCPDGNVTVMVSLCCETDFVAKSEAFLAAADTLADYAIPCPQFEGIDNLLKVEIDGKKFDEVLNELISQTGEKIEIGDYQKYRVAPTDPTELTCKYIHFNKKLGVMVMIETNDPKVAAAEGLKQAGTEVAMHIAATNPLALDKDGIDPEIIEQEKVIIAEQVKNKPENIIDKIIEGKMRKFFAENCLLQQPFVKDDSKTVAEVIAQAGKEAAGQAKIKQFVRFTVG